MRTIPTVLILAGALLLSIPVPASSPTIRVLACGEVKIWDVATRECRLTLQTTTSDTEAMSCTCVAYSPDGARVAAGTASGGIWLWDTAGGQELAHIQTEARQQGLPRHPVRGLGFSADGEAIYFMDFVSLRRWDWRSNRLTTVHQQPTDPPSHHAVFQAIFPIGSERVFCSRADYQAKRGTLFLDARSTGSGELVTSIQPKNPVQRLAMDRDGKLLATAEVGTGSETIRLLDIPSGKEKASTPGHGPPAFSPDGRHLVYLSSKKGGLVFWDQSGERRLVPSGRVEAIAFAPDGRLLVTSEGTEGREQTIRFRDGTSGAVVAELPGHEGKVAGLAFSTDGRYLASAGSRRQGPDRIVYPPPLRPTGGPARSWLLIAILAVGGLVALGVGTGAFVWLSRRGRSTSRNRRG